MGATVYGLVGATDLGSLQPLTCRGLQPRGLQSRDLRPDGLQSVLPIWESLIHPPKNKIEDPSTYLLFREV